MPYLSFRCRAVCRFRSVRGSVPKGASGAIRAWPAVCLCCGQSRDWRACGLWGSECAASAWHRRQNAGPRKTASVPAGRALYVRASRATFRAGSIAPAFRIATRHPAAVGRARQQSGGVVEMRRKALEIQACVNALRGIAEAVCRDSGPRAGTPCMAPRDRAGEPGSVRPGPETGQRRIYRRGPVGRALTWPGGAFCAFPIPAAMPFGFARL